VSPTRVALIGYGLAGRLFHAPFVEAVEGLELAAIVTSDARRRQQARDDHPQAEILATAGEVWERAPQLGLVVVAAPNRAHVPLTRAAIDSDLAVVVDKPFTTTAAEARGLVRDARARGVFLTVFQNRRWDGDVLTLRRLLDAGELGDVFRFESRFERWRPHLRGGWRESGAPDEGGGLLLDLGSHLVDQALHLFGPAERVYAELDVRRRGASVDDDAFVAIGHASGVRSQLWMSAVAAQPAPRLRVLGERAAYLKHGLDIQEEQLVAGLRPGDARFGEEPEERWGTLGADDELRAVPTERGDYAAFYAGVAAALRGEAPPPVDPDEVVVALAALDAARASAAERRVVSL
jgi:predicted dehydrogenase